MRVGGTGLPALTLLLLLAGSAFAQQAPPRDPVRRRPPASGTATIAGVVLIDDGSAKPLRRAKVTATGAMLIGGRTVITHDDGSYRIEGLPPGRYTVRAAKDGYVAMAYGARRASTGGSSVEARARETTGRIDIRLARGAVLSGMVTDVSGQPVPGVLVAALAHRFMPEIGDRQLVATGVTAITDDRGEYRLFGLAAGDYAISAMPRDPAPADVQVVSEAEIRRALSEVQQATAMFRSRPGLAPPPAPPARPPFEPRRSVGFARTYLPGTTRAAQAMIVRVGRAEERSGLDFALDFVPMAGISGTVLMPDAGNWSIEVRLVPTRSPVMADEPRISRTRSGGRFAFGNVPPGQYTLIALPDTGGRPAPAASLVWAMTEVVVDGEPLTDLFLVGQPRARVEGRLVFEGATAPPRLPGFGLPLPLVHTLAGAQAASNVFMQSDGRFTLDAIPGPYRPQPSVPGIRLPIGRWFIDSAKVGGREMLDDPIELRQGLSDLVITLTDRTTEVIGRIVAANGEAEADSFAVFFSTDRHAWFAGSRRVAGVRARDDGTFTVRNLPPGEYYAVALSDIEDGEWRDPELLDRLTDGAVKLRLVKGERKLRDLRVR